MAHLQIKNFPDSLYEKLRIRAKRERRSLSQEVIHILSQALEQDKFLPLSGLRGLGKEIWEGIGAAEHIRAERDSWDDGEDPSSESPEKSTV